jgi:hypothetical protein
VQNTEAVFKRPESLDRGGRYLQGKPLENVMYIQSTDGETSFSNSRENKMVGVRKRERETC